MRTSLFFEFLILILTFRLLVTFFDRFSQAHEDFSVIEMVVLFSSPVAMYLLSFTASQDWGALLVHWPALIGGTLLATGLWPLWKHAAGKREALAALLIATSVIVLVWWSLYAAKASDIAFEFQPHSRMTHRILLREGADAALSASPTGGKRLLDAIQQNWTMMNYAANGEGTGVGYGNAPIRGNRNFQEITLSDLVFSVYVLAEYGAFGGIALLALYLFFFLIVLRMAWDTLIEDPLRMALAGALSLMIVFPAIYMSAANVGEWLFTGQDLPLLGLRSRTDILRVGLILMLLVAALKPIAVSAQQNQPPRWRDRIREGFKLLPTLFNRRVKSGTKNLASDPRSAISATALNLALVGFLLLAAAAVPIAGIVWASGQKDDLKTLDLTGLKQRARTLIERGQIWFQPLAPGSTAGKGCSGEPKNRSASGATVPDITNAYELCIDPAVKGGGAGDTLAELVKDWNGRRQRGDAFSEQHDQRQFYRLRLDAIAQTDDPKLSVSQRSDALAVSPDIYHWNSPFRAPQGWNGSLTDESAINNNGGALVGAGLALPLRSVEITQENDNAEPVRVGAREDLLEKVFLDRPRRFAAKRKFRVYEDQTGLFSGKPPIFEIETVKGAAGAVLRAGSGDFDLFLNGCPLVIGLGKGCELPSESSGGQTGTVPPIRLDFGDVIAYAPRQAGRSARVARHVFTYSRAKLGVYSYQTWSDGEIERVYPQGPLQPLAKQITNAVLAAGTTGQAANQDIALTLDAEISQEMEALLEEQRRSLDKSTPLSTKICSRRRMSVALMETDSGKLLALASNYGRPSRANCEPLDESTNPDSANLNFVSHRIGSAVKPFTASATLNAFPGLAEMTVVDARRQSNRNVLGLPLGGGKGINGKSQEITWDQFLPRSDNLYAVTLSLLGMCEQNGRTIPRFQPGLSGTPLRLVLTDSGPSPIWDDGKPTSETSLFNPKTGETDLLDQTQFAKGLGALFGVRADYPTTSIARYDTSIWSSLQIGQPSGAKNPDSMNIVSPEIPNLGLADVRDFNALRSMLLGGEIGDLPQYGRVGNAWSNVYLAQSLARIVTGRMIRARIIAPTSPTASATPSWPADGYASWRPRVVEGLAGVVSDANGTAHSALAGVAGPPGFRIIGKTGTLDPDETATGNGPLLNDSVFIFTAGIWDGEKFIGRPITGAIYLEQGGIGQAPRLTKDLINRLNNKLRFQWDKMK